MSALKAEALVREFQYNGIRIREPDTDEAPPMQRVARSLTRRSRSQRSLCRKRQPVAHHSDGTAAAAGIGTLTHAFPQGLPSLDTVPTAYSHEFRAELLYELCAALVREGLAGEEIWAKCEGSSVAFVQRAIRENIGEGRRNLLERNVEYHLSVSDVAERDGEDAPLGKGRLTVTIECGGAGYLKMGPAIATMEEEASGLGAAFYWTLTYALYRVMRVYNHDDAFEYEERMKEYAEEDEESREHYEFPEVDKALPECIRSTLTSEDRRAFLRHARRLLQQHRSGRFGSWIRHLHRIDRLSRIRLRVGAAFREDGGSDTIPLPSLVVSFQDHDAIVACFDEESQYLQDGTAEPALGIVFSPQKPDEVRTAVRLLRRFIALNVALFEMLEEIAEWEKRHGGTPIDRGEPSIRAA